MKLTELYKSFNDKPLHEQEEYIPTSGKNLKDLYDGNEPMEIQYHEDQQLYYIEAEDIEAYVHGETVWATDPDRGMEDIEVNRDNSDVTSSAKGLPIAFKHKDAGFPASIKRETKEKNGKRPDYADVDGDGDEEESMEKAFKDKENIKEQGCTEEEIREGTCGYSPDGKPRRKPAGPNLMRERLKKLANLI